MNVVVNKGALLSNCRTSVAVVVLGETLKGQQVDTKILQLFTNSNKICHQDILGFYPKK